MKTYLAIFGLLLILTNQPNANNPLKSIQEFSSYSPFSLIDVNLICIDTTYKVVGRTGSRPSRPLLNIDKYVYNLTFKIVINPDSSWDRTFYLNFLYPDHSFKSVILNEELIKLTFRIIRT